MQGKHVGLGVVVAVVVIGAAFLLVREEPPVVVPGAPGTPGGTRPVPGKPGVPGDPRPAPGVASPLPLPGPLPPAPPPHPGAPPAPRPGAPPAVPGAPTPTPLPVGNRHVTVQVHDSKGNGVGGVAIGFRTDGENQGPETPAYTDASGKASYDLPAAKALIGFIRHPRLKRTQEFRGEPRETQLTVRLELGDSGQIHGCVHDQDGPVPEPELHFLDDRGQETVIGPEGQLRDDHGNFRCDVAPGRYTIHATAKGYTPSDKAYATAPQGGEAGPIDLLLVKRGRLAGKVQLPRDLEAAREPPAIAFTAECVRGSATNPYTTQKVITLTLDPGGLFVLEDMDAGQYRLRAQLASDPSRMGPWVPTAPLAAGQRIDGLVLSLEGATLSVRGVVRDRKSGKPLPQATVSVTGAAGRSVIDGQGRFELRGLDPGRREVVAELEGYARTAQSVEIPKDQASPLTLDLALEPKGRVEGTVTQAGKPAPNALVAIVFKAPGGGFRPIPPTTADAKGAYAFENLEPGRYYLKCGPAATDPWSEQGAVYVEIAAGETSRVPLEIK